MSFYDSINCVSPGSKTVRGLGTGRVSFGARKHQLVKLEKEMTCRGRSLIVLFLLTVNALCCCCAFAHAGEKKDEAVTITDFRGKTLTFERPAERIICLIESALSAIYMLEAEKQIVGISSNVYQGSVYPYYAALDKRIKDKAIAAPGNWDFVNVESVIVLKPDVVILWSKQTESIAALEERGIKVFGIFIESKEDVYREILELGKLTGKLKRAETIVKFTMNEIMSLSRRLDAVPVSRRPGVYYMWAQGNLETSCGGSTVDDLINIAGGRNVCSSIQKEHTTVNLETVMAWNPEIIVMWYNERKDPSDILNDEQWKRIKAVKNKRVHEFQDIFLCDLWTLKYTYAVKMVAKWLHPELFRDIDLEKEKRTMLTFLYGKNFGNIIP